MSLPVPHIVRQQEKALLDGVTMALENPEKHPLLFHLWGIGGVGKSTALLQLEKQHKDQSSILKISFGISEETPLTVMEKLHTQLPNLGLHKKDIRNLMDKSDPFTDKLNEFKNTLLDLETQPIEGQQTVSK